MDKIDKVAVICGGSSPERDISLQSGEGVFKALIDLGYDACLIDFNDLNSIDELNSYDFTFIALHGFEGEGGDLQKKLDEVGISYTGSGPHACKNTWDKSLCKKILSDNNVNTPNWKIYNSLLSIEQNLITDKNLSTSFLKPCSDGSSVDIYKIKSSDDFHDAIKNSTYPDRPFILEECIDGKEFTVTVINEKCYPVIEILTENEFYDYDAKYISNNTGLIEANLTSEELSAINVVASNAYKALNCRGWARIDILQDIKGQFHVLEINTVPGMTSHSCVPKSGSFLGMEYKEVVQKIIDASL